MTKNAGGGASEAKLEAARALGLPVVMVAQPAPGGRGGGAETVADVAAALAWLDHRYRAWQETQDRAGREMPGLAGRKAQDPA